MKTGSIAYDGLVHRGYVRNSRVGIVCKQETMRYKAATHERVDVPTSCIQCLAKGR